MGMGLLKDTLSFSPGVLLPKGSEDLEQHGKQNAEAGAAAVHVIFFFFFLLED